MTCFLVDDDPEDQEIFVYALEGLNAGIHCIMADDGDEALTKLLGDEQFIPDYIFLDLNMARMGGKECLLEIKKIERLRDVPVVIYSTSSTYSDIVETKRLGAAEFITKPSTIVALTQKLAKFFNL